MATDKNRGLLLGDFYNTAYQHYAGNVDPSLVSLLPKLTALVPENAFAPVVSDDLVTLLGEINEDSAQEFIDSLTEIDLNLAPEKTIQVVISSPGGEVHSGLLMAAMVNHLRRKGRVLNCHVGGWALSMAFDLLQHFDHRSMDSTAFLMVHEEQYSTAGSTSSHKSEVQFSEKQERAMLLIVSQRTGKPVDYYMKRTKNANWYIGAEEALAEGLIDEVIGVPGFKPGPQPIEKPKRTRKAPVKVYTAEAE